MFMRQHIASRIGKKFLKNELLILLENWAAHFGQRVDTGQPNFFGDSLKELEKPSTLSEMML